MSFHVLQFVREETGFFYSALSLKQAANLQRRTMSQGSDLTLSLNVQILDFFKHSFVSSSPECKYSLDFFFQEIIKAKWD